MPLPELSDEQRAWYILQGYKIIIDQYGTRGWYLNGKLHRDDGPAIEFLSGARRWYKNGELHREDGPAVEYANGNKAWYLNGEGMTEEEHKLAVAKLGN